jgi:hypothetical protein
MCQVEYSNGYATTDMQCPDVAPAGVRAAMELQAEAERRKRAQARPGAPAPLLRMVAKRRP